MGRSFGRKALLCTRQSCGNHRAVTPAKNDRDHAGVGLRALAVAKGRYEYRGRSPQRSEMEHAQAYARKFVAFMGRNAQLAYRVAYAMLRNGSDAENARGSRFEALPEQALAGPESESAFTACTVWRIA